MQSTPTPDQNYLDPKILERIQRIDVRARLVVEGFMTGQHRSPYNGYAVEFATHREYSPGDDLRHIDWKVWSKTDRLYIKQFEEETNLQCHLIVDCSKSMEYGSQTGWSKYDYAATASACLGYLMQQQQDSVGLVLFSDRIDIDLKPKSHPSHLKLIFHELAKASPAGKTDVTEPFLVMAGKTRKRGMAILFSDLFFSPDDLGKGLNQFRLRGEEVIVFHVMHSDELEFPFDQNTLFQGLEVSTELYAEPRALRSSYLQAVQDHVARVKKVCASLGIDYLLMDTSKSLAAILSSYLNFRARSRRKI